MSQEKLILVVDDEPSIRDFMRHTLETRAYGVDLAESGWEALAKFDQRTYAAVILDIMMPRMSGTELATHLRAQEESELTPIILMSAVRNPISIPNTIYLPKPFDIEHVLELVTLLLPA